MNAVDPTSTPQPQMIGRYEVKSRIGRGGMATVYQAYDPRFKRDVAIKVMPAELLSDPTLRARFEREAETIAALEHRAIVPVYDYGEQDGQPYLVMRYMPQGTLADVIRQGPLTLDQAAMHLRRLGSALDHVHSHGVVHRDLKPGNIMFDEYGEAYLADFGIVRLTEATSNLTGTGVVGTPAYMSPEQVRSDSTIDHRSDIYALGVILFELLTEKLPYEADTPVGMAMMHVTDPLPQIAAVRPGLPAGTQDVINKAMAKNREDRYANALALASAVTDLANVAARGGAAATVFEAPATPATVVEAPYTAPPTMSTPPPVYTTPAAPSLTPVPTPAHAYPTTRPPEARRRSPWLWVGGILLLVLIGGGVAAAAGVVGFSNLFGSRAEPTVAPTAVPPTATLPGPTEAPSAADAPETTMLVPAADEQVEVELGGDPLQIRVLAVAPAGVSRVDLKVNGDLADARSGDDEQTSMTADFAWLPPDVGLYLLSVETVASDGTVSPAVAITALVLEPQDEPTITATATTGAATATPTTEPTPTATRASTSGGGTSGGGTPGERSVDGTYTSSATNVVAGQSVTLSWDLTSSADFIFSLELWEFPSNASQPVKHSIVDAVKEHAGSLTFTPSATTTYRLDAYFNDENEQATVQQREITVTVGGSGGTTGGTTGGTSGGSTGGASGGPIVLRDPPVASFVSATRMNDAGNANITLSLELRGGSAPYTITGDGVGAPQTRDVTGTFTADGFTWNFIHFQVAGKCGGGFPASVNVTGAGGSSATASYFINSVQCN